jgi:cytochrome P450
MNPRTEAALQEVLKEIQFVTAPDLPERVDPDGWAARIFNAAKAGQIEPEQCPAMVLDYINPSLDTTIAGMATLLYVFGRHPDQWEILRANPSLIPNAINEAVRWMSPLRFFARIVREETRIEGVTLPKGARVLMMYASANRDERFWEAPERFDITRSAAGHLGFGAGVHACMGQNLARLEIRSVLEAMVPRVKRVEVIEAVLGKTHILRSFERMTVRFVPV